MQLATPDKFGVFANIFSTSQARADEPNNVLGTQELGYQVIVTESPGEEVDCEEGAGEVETAEG